MDSLSDSAATDDADAKRRSRRYNARAHGPPFSTGVAGPKFSYGHPTSPLDFVSHTRTVGELQLMRP